MAFDPEKIRSFHFVDYELDAESAEARFRYRFDPGPTFVETFALSESPLSLEREQAHAVDLCLRHLFLVAGVSYYKAAVPPEIRLEAFSIPPATAAFLDDLYLHGLGEFAYRNRLDLRGRIRFPSDPSIRPEASDWRLPRRTLVPLGGGKDSLVTVEALRSAGEPIATFSVGLPGPIARCVARTGVPHLAVRRRISPELLELNERGALNGHVPVSAIVSLAAATVAALRGFDAVAMSNERSAEAGNVEYLGLAVNHQYSKSLRFERALSHLLASSVHSGLRYFSFLRPLSELEIARRFAAHPRYLDAFCSCNAAFRISGDGPSSPWCGSCPKCRFVFLVLAPFVERPAMLRVFGHDLLDDRSQIEGFDELLGRRAHKPFECVGEPEEVVAALLLLSEKAEWREDAVVRRFADELQPKLENPAAILERVRTASPAHALPSRFEAILRADS